MLTSPGTNTFRVIKIRAGESFEKTLGMYSFREVLSWHGHTDYLNRQITCRTSEYERVVIEGDFFNFKEGSELIIED